MQDLLQIISLQASGLSSNEMFVASSIVLVAAVIRGYAGFGFSAKKWFYGCSQPWQ